MVQYVGAVQTRADLSRFSGMPAGTVLRIVDENKYVVWAEPAPAGSGTQAPPAGTLEAAMAVTTAGWVDVPDGAAATAGAAAGRALVDGHWPYVVGADMIAAYPEVSHDLANKAAALAASWAAYRDGRPWLEWAGGAAATHTPQGLAILPATGEDGGYWIVPGNSQAWRWQHGGAWRDLFTVDWATYSAPNGPRIWAGPTQARFELLNPLNRYNGTFFPAGRATAAARTVPHRAALVDPPAPAAGEEPLPDGSWDLAATVADLVALVNTLADRIDTLEAKP